MPRSRRRSLLGADLRWRRWLYRARLAPLMVAGLAALVLPGRAPTQTPMPGSPPMTAHPLDEGLALLAEGKQSYQGIRDYSCTMIKQERIRGELQPESIIAMKFRQQPFSVYMRWLAPRSMANQEVAYVHGRNRNQMRVHSKGILGVAGFVSVDVTDPRVMKQSRHTLYEAGLGNLIDQTMKAWQRDRQQNKGQVRTGEYNYANRRCLRVEVIHTEYDPTAYCYRGVVFIDKEWKLPVRAEMYDWPRQGGPADGELLESYSYINLQFNGNLSDADFVR